MASASPDSNASSSRRATSALSLRKCGFGFADGLGVFLAFAEPDHRELIVEFLVDAAKRVELIFQRVALAHQLLCARLIVPEIGIFGPLFSSARRRFAVSTSKMPPQQPERPLDVFDQVWVSARMMGCSSPFT